jgi:hypothetical protein
MKNFLSKAKSSVLKALKIFGNIQSSILLAIFYFLIFGPFAIIYQFVKVFSAKEEKNKSYWIKKDRRKPTAESLQKQY